MPDASSVAQSLINLGLSPYGASALAARAGVESSYNPNVYGDNGTSYGLWQFHGPRMDALKSFAQANNADPSDPTVQAKYLVHELGTTESAAGNVLRTASTPEQAAAGALMFERPKGYTPQNPLGGLGGAATVAGTRAIAAGLGGSPTIASSPSPQPMPSQPAPDDPPIPPIQPQPQQQAAQAPTANLGMSALGQAPQAGQQAQQAASLLAQFIQQQGGPDQGAPGMMGGVRPIQSILGRRAA